MALVVIGVGAPELAARAAARHGSSAVGTALGSEFVTLLICIGVIWWLGRRVAMTVPVRS